MTKEMQQPDPDPQEPTTEHGFVGPDGPFYERLRAKHILESEDTIREALAPEEGKQLLDEAKQTLNKYGSHSEHGFIGPDAPFYEQLSEREKYKLPGKE